MTSPLTTFCVSSIRLKKLDKNFKSASKPVKDRINESKDNLIATFERYKTRCDDIPCMSFQDHDGVQRWIRLNTSSYVKVFNEKNVQSAIDALRLDDIVQTDDNALESWKNAIRRKFQEIHRVETRKIQITKSKPRKASVIKSDKDAKTMLETFVQSTHELYEMKLQIRKIEATELNNQKQSEMEVLHSMKTNNEEEKSLKITLKDPETEVMKEEQYSITVSSSTRRKTVPKSKTDEFVYDAIKEAYESLGKLWNCPVSIRDDEEFESWKKYIGESMITKIRHFGEENKVASEHLLLKKRK